MHVMHVISALQLGGAERLAIDLAIQHVRSGGTSAVVTVRRPSNAEDPLAHFYRDTLQTADIPYYELGHRNWGGELAYLPLKLCRLIDKFSPALLHSHTDIPDFVVSGARRIRRFEIVRTIHNTSLWPVHWWAGFVTEQGFRDDLVIGVSEDSLTAYEQLRHRYRLRSSAHRSVIKNGVHVRSLEVLDAMKRRRGTSPLRVAYFGRSDEAKGLDLLLEAVISHIGQQVSSMELSVFSDAAFKPEFQMRAAEAPCPLHLLPPVPNAWETMGDFDVIVMPSRVEGLPLVALEALASGTPVITTQIPGLREAVPPEWPLSIPPNDPVALASILTRVLQGQFDLPALGRAGYHYVKEQTVEAAFQKYHAAYTSHLSRSRHERPCRGLQ